MVSSSTATPIPMQISREDEDREDELDAYPPAALTF